MAERLVLPAACAVVLLAAWPARAADCNNNGIEDATDIADATSADCNMDGRPDECEGDLDGDGTIDGCDECGVQLSDNDLEDGWGNRQATASRGMLLWFDSEDTIHLYDGAQASAIQAADVNDPSLDGVAEFVFTLGSGAAPGEVIGAWRRGTDFAWVFRNGQPPVLVNAVNPYDANLATNPEAATVADGCAFLALQSFDPDSPLAIGIKHVYQVDPVSGDATLLTSDFLDDGDTAGSGASSVGLLTSGCKAAWNWCGETDDSFECQRQELHYFDGSDVQILATDAMTTSFAQGRLIYIKAVGGVEQVFLYDTNLPNPAPVQLTDFGPADKRPLFAESDGRHVAILLGDANRENRELVTLGGFQLSDANTQPADQPDNRNFPIQVDRGQILWQTQIGSLLAFDGRGLDTACGPGEPVWLADGFAGMSRKSETTGADLEVYVKQFSPPADESLPYAPWFVTATTTANGQIDLAWEPILGATEYRVYLAAEPGVTQDNFAALAGGQMVNVAAGHATTITGLNAGSNWYFVVAAVDDGVAGPDSVEVSASGCADQALDADGDGTPDCMDDCGGDAEKTQPGACGCGEPEADVDADGTPDCIDDAIDQGNDNDGGNTNDNGAGNANDNLDDNQLPADSLCGNGGCGAASVMPMALLLACLTGVRRGPAKRRAARGRVWLSLLLVVALHPLAGATTCDPNCTPEHPDYDPLTGLCTQPAGGDMPGPPVYGTGGLPTEPNTPTTQPEDELDENSVDLDVYGLNGRWLDGAYEACIEHAGSSVSAVYVELRECDHADGTGNVSLYDADFEGELVGDTITGTTVTCKYGFDPGQNGLINSPITLTVSQDGKTLSGTWYSEVDDAEIVIELTRESVGGCHMPG